MRLGMLANLARYVNFGRCVFVAGLCVNDVTAGTTAANIQAMIQWLAPGPAGVQPGGPVLQHLHAGCVTSTDSFATVANQSVSSSYDADRKTVNTWLRAGGGGLFTGQSGRTRTGSWTGRRWWRPTTAGLGSGTPA